MDLFDTVVVRLGGEIGIKAPWTRKQYERRLVSNIKTALKCHNLPCLALVRTAGRLYIRTEHAEETARKMSRVFGISSLSPAIQTSSSLDDILEVSAELAGLRFEGGRSFAVRCRRVGKHPYTSQDLCRKIGERITALFPQSKLRVDLKNPEQAVQVEVRDDKAYLFTDVIKGVGGLPLGTQPKLVCLLKGDIQSAVACWMTMKRGCPAILVYIENSVMATRENTRRTQCLAQTLMKWNVGFPRRLRMIRFDCSLKKTLEEFSLDSAVLLRKRLMLRSAQRIAEKESAEGIVTADTLGRRAHQTIQSFKILDEAARGFPVYRPLVGLDDEEIVAAAMAIGLERTVTKKIDHVEPNIRVGLEKVREIERELNIERIVERAVESLKILEL